jgi:enoyl-[acyl-carrier protein] reductase/trans-2-enoyl-CoA reductase (NAD+)
MIIQPKIRGFVCVTAHPDGCAAHVQQQIDLVRARGEIKPGPKSVLVVGASTGYGLASRITAAFGSGADTFGVFFERNPEPGKLATAGWYNNDAFEKKARTAGLKAASINGDAFSDAIKQQTIEQLKAQGFGPVDLVVYSLASPRRTHPKTGVTHKSTLKPIGASFTSKTVDTDKGVVSEITLEPANDAEIADTIAVMGGEDWEMWIHALDDAKLLAPGATTVAFSYIGPEQTWQIYKNGTIGKAKEDLEKTAHRLDAYLKATYGRAFISVNKALVTQASSAIPVVPLYISLLYRVMKAKGLHEGCIEQMQRLFATQMYGGNALTFDEGGRIRLDDWEMRPDVQAEVAALWPKVTTENLTAETDIAGYREEFLRLFGFGLPGIDYTQDTPV